MLEFKPVKKGDEAMTTCKKCKKEIPYHENRVFVHIQIAPENVLDYFFHVKCFADLLKPTTGFARELRNIEAFRKIFKTKEKEKVVFSRKSYVSNDSTSIL